MNKKQRTDRVINHFKLKQIFSESGACMGWTAELHLVISIPPNLPDRVDAEELLRYLSALAELKFKKHRGEIQRLNEDLVEDRLLNGPGVGLPLGLFKVTKGKQ